MISLPISGLQAQWRPATGHADIVLAESPPGLAGAVAYASSGAEAADGAPLDGAGLPIGDLDFLIVSRRRRYSATRLSWPKARAEGARPRSTCISAWRNSPATTVRGRPGPRCPLPNRAGGGCVLGR